MDISCYLVSNGEFKQVKIPEKLFTELSKNLRNNGVGIVQFKDRSILVEGIYVPAKGTKNSLLVVSGTEV